MQGLSHLWSSTTFVKEMQCVRDFSLFTFSDSPKMPPVLPIKAVEEIILSLVQAMHGTICGQG